MIDSNLPDEGTAGDDALSFDDGVDAIADSLDPETDLEEERRPDETEADDEADADEGEEADSDEEESDAEATDDEGQDDASEGDEPDDDIKGGRFAPDNAKVKLEDGSVVSIADLKRGTLFQADYTRKTQALSEEKKAFEAERQQVSEYSRTLAQQRDFLLQAAQQFLPKQPDKSLIHTDIIGYQEQLAEYQEKMGILQQMHQLSTAEQQRQQQEQEQAYRERIKSEADKLVQAMPELKDPATYNKFWNDAVSTMAEYGFTDEELSQNATDHRFFKVFRDLMKYRKARQAAPKVKKDVQSRPVMKPGKRMDPKAKTSREQAAKSEALRKTGSFEAGVSALMDLDL